MTKKELVDILDNLPDDAEIVPHERSNEYKDSLPYVSYDRTNNQIILFAYYYLGHV